ncbi:MAG: hypothetical protein WDA15_08015 [Trueperaceae bacterium]|jgi:hypothetical protein
MRRLLFTAMLVFAMVLPVAFAQQGAVLSGLIQSTEPLAENTLVAIHVVDADNVWGLQVASVVPVAGTFRITPGEIPSEHLRPFRSGSVILPGLQNEYRVAPDDVNVAVARINIYVDENGNNLFDRLVDRTYIGITNLDNPIGFYTLLYVDRAATLTAAGVELQMQPGWNVFTVRWPGDTAVFDMTPSVEDIVLDVSLQ